MFFLFFLDICKFCITLLFFYLFSIFIVYAFLFLSIFYSFFAKSYIFYYDNVGPPYYFCAVCEKPIFEGEELPDDSPDDSVCCDNCALWFHFHCQKHWRSARVALPGLPGGSHDWEFECHCNWLTLIITDCENPHVVVLSTNEPRFIYLLFWRTSTS